MSQVGVDIPLQDTPFVYTHKHSYHKTTKFPIWGHYSAWGKKNQQAQRLLLTSEIQSWDTKPHQKAETLKFTLMGQTHPCLPQENVIKTSETLYFFCEDFHIT